MYSVVAGFASLVATVATFTVTTAVAGLGVLGGALGWAAGLAWGYVASITRVLFITALVGPAAATSGTVLGGVWAGLVAISKAGVSAVVRVVSAGMAGMSAAMTAARPVITAVWAAMHLGLFRMSLAWRVYIAAIWSITLQALTAITAAFASAVSGIWGAIPLAMAARMGSGLGIIYALWAAAHVGYLGIMQAFWIQAETLSFIGGYAVKAVHVAWSGAMLAITSGWAVLSAAILARLGPTMATIWRATGVSMVVITAVWQNAIVKGYALFQTAMVGMTVAWGAFMRGIWTAVAASWAVGLRSPYALMLAMTSGVMAGYAGAHGSPLGRYPELNSCSCVHRWRNLDHLAGYTRYDLSCR